MEELTIREFVPGDYEGAYGLWQTIHGFGIRSVDDSYSGVIKFLQRNPGCSVVAEISKDSHDYDEAYGETAGENIITNKKEIVGTILCGHDGRTASFYHVCVREDYRRQGIGKQMVVACMKQLKLQKVNKISLIAFKGNELGNNFWNGEGWTCREDVNTYDFVLNEENITRFNN